VVEILRRAFVAQSRSPSPYNNCLAVSPQPRARRMVGAESLTTTTINCSHGIDISVICMTGITFRDGSDCAKHDVAATATVAFGGSVKDMEVNSSSFCAYTGQLMIESERIALAGRKKADNSLEAKWGARGKALARLVREETKPHLRIRFKQNSGMPAMRRSRIDSHSSVVPHHSAKERDDEHAVAAVQGLETPRDSVAVWADDAHQAMPEIVELSIRIRSKNPQYADQVGVAHLVLLGQDSDRVVDLAVKPSLTIQGYQPNDDTRPPVLRLGHFSRLRVWIRPIQDDNAMIGRLSGASIPFLTRASSSSSSGSKETMESDRFELEPTIEAMWGDMRSHKHQFLNCRENRETEFDARPPNVSGLGSSFTCGSLEILSQFLEKLRWRCDDDNFVASDQSIDSTIATRDSMLL
jgi:hypothetical protein